MFTNRSVSAICLGGKRMLGMNKEHVLLRRTDTVFMRRACGASVVVLFCPSVL